MTGQYASRHGIIDNVARDAMSHRLPNYHLDLQRLGDDEDLKGITRVAGRTSSAK